MAPYVYAACMVFGAVVLRDMLQRRLSPAPRFPRTPPAPLNRVTPPSPSPSPASEAPPAPAEAEAPAETAPAADVPEPVPHIATGTSDGEAAGAGAALADLETECSPDLGAEGTGVISEPAEAEAPPAKPGIVYASRDGARYHREGCRTLHAAPTALDRETAEAQGRTPCEVCDP